MTLQQPDNVRSLGRAMLEQQPAALMQVRCGRGGDRDQGVETGGSCHERHRGLGPKFFQRRVAGGDVGRVGEDQVESFAGNRFEPGTQAPVNLCEP